MQRPLGQTGEVAADPAEVSGWSRSRVCDGLVSMGAGDRDLDLERKKRRPNEDALEPEAELCEAWEWSAGTGGPIGVVADRVGWPVRGCEDKVKEFPRAGGVEDDWLAAVEALSIGGWLDDSVPLVILPPSLLFGFGSIG